MISRRRVFAVAAGALSVLGLPRWRIDRATAQPIAAGVERHGLSAFGDLMYPADFTHFEYVNPRAPKGGLFSQIGPSRQFNQNGLTFNSLNSYILKGDAAQGWNSRLRRS